MIFIFGLGLVGVVALFAVVYSGFRYLIAGSSDARRQESKRGIWAAVSGLAILLFSYLILSTINPQLVSLQEPNLTQQTTVSSAAPYGLEAPLSSSANPASPADYIRTFFIYGLGLVGLAALFGIVYGGFVYFLSAGNQAMKTHGRRWILSALSGLVLLLCSYAILYTINPQLVSWNGKGLDKVFVSGQNTPANSQKPSTETNQKLFGSELDKLNSLPENTLFADLIVPAEYCPSVTQTNAIKTNSPEKDFSSLFLPLIKPALAQTSQTTSSIPPIEGLPNATRAYISSSLASSMGENIARAVNTVRDTLPEEQQAAFNAKDKVFLSDQDYSHILPSIVKNGTTRASTTDGVFCLADKGEPNSIIINVDEGDVLTLYHETMHIIDLQNATWNNNTSQWDNALSSPLEFVDLYNRSLEYADQAQNILNSSLEPVEPIPHAGFVSDYASRNILEYFAELGTNYYQFHGDPSKISEDPSTQKLIQEGFDYLLKVKAVKPDFPQFIQPPSAEQ